MTEPTVTLLKAARSYAKAWDKIPKDGVLPIDEQMKASQAALFDLHKAVIHFAKETA